MKITTRHQIAFKSQDKKQDKTVDKFALITYALKEASKCRGKAGRYYGLDTFFRKILCLSPFFIAMGGLEIVASKLKLLKNYPFAKMRQPLGFTFIASCLTFIGLTLEAYTSNKKGAYQQYKESADRLEGNVKKIFLPFSKSTGSSKSLNSKKT